jgi:uncharacterized lipoprotein YmbA
MTGCSSKRYYTLGDTSNISIQNPYKKPIGIEKIEIPKYLKDNSLVKQVTPYRVERIEDATWLTPMQKHLTNVLINYLQKSLNNPDISLYPWESHKKISKKVSLKITRFIAYNQEVILEGSYQIENLENKTSHTELFSKKVATGEKSEEMMKAMEEAYFLLASELSNKISN